MKTIDVDITKNLNLLRKIAWIFYRRSGQDWDDLFQDAAYIYLKTIHTYNPRKGALSTYMWRVVSNGLEDRLYRERTKYSETVTDPSETLLENIGQEPSLFWETLTEEAYEIAKKILDAAESFQVMSPPDAMTRVRKMMEEQGWTCTKIEKGIKDLQLAFID